MTEILQHSVFEHREGAAVLAAPSSASTGGCLRSHNEESSEVARRADQDPMERFSSTYRRLKDEGALSISGYVLFSSHTDALALFQASKEEDVPARISPTPRDARASCGVALLISTDDAERMYSLACERGIPVESMVALPNQINAHRDRYC